MESTNNDSQIKKGVLELPILLSLFEQRYVSEILKLLNSEGLFIPEGTIYPILTRLIKLGYVSYTWRESQSGPPRKYFLITPEGEKYLKETLKTIEELFHQITNLKKKYLK